jgi:sporulation protein YlmC with PRC-barrel domain/ribosomal protein L40E
MKLSSNVKANFCKEKVRNLSSQKKFYKREDVMGKKVVNQDALEVGSVKDTAFDIEGKLHLIVTKKDSEEEDFVSISDIKAFGDYILLKAPPAAVIGTSQETSQTAITSKTCPKCGHVNSPNVGYCTKCGTKLM